MNADSQEVMPPPDDDVRIYMKLKNEMLATKFTIEDMKKKAMGLKENISMGKVQVAMATLNMGQQDRFVLQIENQMTNMKKIY